MNRVAAIGRWGALLALPGASVVAASALHSFAVRSGHGTPGVRALTLLVPFAALAVVPGLAYRWSRSVPKTIVALAAALVLSGAIVLVLIIAILESVGES